MANPCQLLSRLRRLSRLSGPTPPNLLLSVSTELDADGISANFMLGQETKDSYPGIWLTSKNSNTGRAGFWFCLELPNETNDMVKGYLYAGDDETETDQPLAVIADGVRNDDDDSKRVLWVDGSLTHVEPLTDNYLKRQGAATEKQLDEYDARTDTINFPT